MIILKKIYKLLFMLLTVPLLCNCIYAGSAVNRYNDMAPPFADETEIILQNGIENARSVPVEPSYSVPVIMTVIIIGVLLFALVVGLGIIGRSRR